jgi:tetratricopeptide (TPR) repeat protein
MSAEPSDILRRAAEAAESGDAWQAVLRLRELLASPGPLGPAWADAVRVAERIGDDFGAVAAARRLVGEAPGNVDAAFLLASVLTEAGRADEAAELLLPLADAGRLAPNQVFKLTRMLMFAGRLDEAQGRARRLLEGSPDSPTLWERIAQTKTFAGGDPDVDVMRRLLERTPESRPAARSAIAVALAKAYVDLGDDPAADTALEAHAAAQRRRFPLDLEAWRRGALSILQAFGALAPPPPSAAPTGAARPIYIIGPPRSGTSLLDQVFSRHPWIRGGGELRAYALASRVLGGLTAPDILAWLERAGREGLDPWREVGRRYVVLTEELFGEAAHFTDKLLSNVHRVGAIVRGLPQAAIVHVARDPLDVAWSCWRAQFDADSAWSGSPEGIACYLGHFDRAMRTWHELHPDRIARVAYEDLVREPGATIPRLLEACGLPDDPATREPHLSRRPVSTISYAQVREPIHARRVHSARDFPRATRRLAAALAREGLL